jgi:hypothetical protein
MICRWFGVEAVKMSSTPPPPKRAICELHPAAMPAMRRTAAPRDKISPLRRKTFNCIALTRAYPELTGMIKAR